MPDNRDSGSQPSPSARKQSLLQQRLQKARQKTQQSNTIPRRPEGTAVPLSFAQERLWFLDRLEPDSSVYSIPMALWLTGPLDVAALQQSMTAVVQRHEALRTTFKQQGNATYQSIAAEFDIPLPVEDLTAVPTEARTAEIQTRARQEAQTPFDLSQDNLIRARLLRLADEEHVLILVKHHIISDGWSLNIFLKEMVTAYQALIEGQEPELPELPIQYPDYALWQRQWLQGEVVEKQVDYWKRQLEGAPHTLDIPADHSRPVMQSFDGDMEIFEIPEPLAGRLRELAQFQNVSMFMLMLAAYQLFLYRYTGQNDLLVGSPIANRNRSELEGLIGFFVNTIILRGRVRPYMTFLDYLKQVRQTTLDAYSNQDLPFEKLVEALQPERDLSRSPLFQVMFGLQPDLPTLRAGDLEISLAFINTKKVKFDLHLSMYEDGRNTLRGLWQYNTHLFERETVQRMVAHFLILLEGIAANAETAVAQLPLLTAEEQKQLAAWEGNTAEYPRHLTLSELVEAQAARTPEQTALITSNQTLSYADLNRRANQLAHYLRLLKVGPEQRVGIFVDRTAEMLVALLATLKAGGAYVPLDPAYPQERVAFMLEDSGARVILTQQHLLKRLPPHRGRVVALDRDWTAVQEQPATNPAPTADPANLAYLIYTSGSTGRPKGVAISHGSASAMIHWAATVFSGETLEGVLAATSICFDLSIYELFLPLSQGGCIILADNALHLLSHPQRDRVTLVNTVPSAMTELVRSQRLPVSVETVNLAGEPLKRDLVDQIYARSNAERVYNLYGPSEDTTYSTVALVPAGETTEPTIGIPIDNTWGYVLDGNLTRLPVGIAGELYLSGDDLARGYLGRSAKTAVSFLPNPFSDQPGSRMYKTGDLVRWLPDGQLEFLGRIDHQVKIRGYRIELGEIEVTLTSHPAINEALVVAYDGRDSLKQMAAYLIPERPQSSPTNSDLRGFLTQTLPDYMVPSAFVMLDEWPLTPNGKINRKALPDPETARQTASETAEVKPKTASQTALPLRDFEQSIADIWQEVLQVDKVGASDNFFDLGGHSLLLAQVHTRLQSLFPSLAMIDLLKYPSVRSLAEYLDPQTKPETAEKVAVQMVRRSKTTTTDIAVVGMDGRFPGANNVGQFWQNIRDGVESITFFSDEELLEAGVDPEKVANPNFIKAAPLLDDIEWMDAYFFGLTPREAEITDPQHRLFLETAWNALEGSGYVPEKYPGNIGVFAGVSQSTYFLYHLFNRPDLDIGGLQRSIANDKDYLPTRVAYKLNLTGPAMAVQSACSTSLLAIHIACQNLMAGECDMALAGGATVVTPHNKGYIHIEDSIMSPDGHCRAFDADAAGTVPSNGVGVVVLKRLDDARADGDTIYAVIKGSAANNDGSDKVGYTAPSVEGQTAVIRQALANAGVPADTIQFVETHGTGTSLGDPIEFTALTQAFGDTPSGDNCALGALKTNIGHMDAAAGVGGFIKTVMALYNRTLPPNLHFNRPNPQINFEQSPFYINTEAREWQRVGQPRRAGVSSFGIGGTNVHVILEEAPQPEPARPDERPQQLLTLSARSRRALDAMTANLAGYLSRTPEAELADVAYTLQTGRQRFGERRTVVCGSVEEAVEALNFQTPTCLLSQASEQDSREAVFMFPGQGSQYVNMGLDLYRDEALFREVVNQCAGLLEPHLGLDIRAVLYPAPENAAEAEEQLRQTAVTQPALFIVSYAMARLWQSWGIRPTALIGHSIGEYVAACLAGVFTLEEALHVVAARGKIMQMQSAGSMLAVSLAEERLQPYLNGKQDPNSTVSVATINAPENCVVAGPDEAIEALHQKLTAENISSRPLHTSHAFHSAMMEGALKHFEQFMTIINMNVPQIPFVSNISGTWITAAEATSPAYWASQIRQPVRFSDGISHLLAELPSAAFIEVGPGQSLTALTKRHLADEDGALTFATMRHPKNKENDYVSLLNAAGQFWMAGGDLDWTAFHGTPRRRVALPTYPFERQKYWIEPKPRTAETTTAIYKKPNISDWFYTPGWQTAPPLVSVNGSQQPAHWLLLGEDADFTAELKHTLEASGQSVSLAMDDGSNDLSDHIILDTTSSEGLAGFQRLLSLAQTLGPRRDKPVAIHVVTTAAQQVLVGEEIVPERTGVLALAKVIVQEYGHLTCQVIDADVLDKSFVAQLPGRCLHPADVSVAYRLRQWWTPMFHSLPLVPKTAVSAGADLAPIKAGGVYLITGGLGQIGLALAKHLAGHSTANQPITVVLTSRSADAVNNEQLQQLKDLGATVIVQQADVTDLGTMTAVFESMQSQYGRVDGVFHLARLVDEDSFTAVSSLTMEMVEKQIRPKLEGARVLAQLFEQHPVDFCLVFSSLSSQLGGLKMGAYATANQVTDAFAQQQNATGKTNWMAVNWDGWHFEGANLKGAVALALAPDEGLEALMRILGAGHLPQTIVSTGDLMARYDRWVGNTAEQEAETAEQPTKTAYDRPDLPTDYAEPRTEIEATIAGIWGALLGLKEVGIHDNFFTLGGDSLLGTEVVERLRQTFETDFPLELIFEGPTVAQLAFLVVQKRIEQADGDDFESILALVEGLGEDEVDTLLALLPE